MQNASWENPPLPHPQDLVNQLRRTLKVRDATIKTFQDRAEDLAETKTLLSAGGHFRMLSSLLLSEPVLFLSEPIPGRKRFFRQDGFFVCFPRPAFYPLLANQCGTLQRASPVCLCTTFFWCVVCCVWVVVRCLSAFVFFLSPVRHLLPMPASSWFAVFSRTLHSCFHS